MVNLKVNFMVKAKVKVNGLQWVTVGLLFNINLHIVYEGLRLRLTWVDVG